MAAIRGIRALSLLSGGLDSLLAVKVLEEQGIRVTGVTFTSPFFGATNAEKGAAALRIELLVRDITDEIIALVKAPPHGFGRQMNPCIDCHALMVRKAGELMRGRGFDFVATGEVLGERPMSQNRQSLDTVARESGVGDLLLRPLSARLLSLTRPEREGLVDRERLLAIEGRSRRPQIELAGKYGITGYVQPAGGCLLTDPRFSARLSELLEMEPGAQAREMRLLTMGRHFRLPSGAKAIVGRDEGDNGRIAAAAGPGDLLIVSDVIPGPTLLLVRAKGEGDLELAARVCASFADNGGREVEMALRSEGRDERIRARPSPRGEFDSMRI
jgi:tRNA-specific 2-thiouridylase